MCGGVFTNQAAIVIAVYLLVMLAIGAWGLRIRGLEEFHLAGRSLRIILLTGTFCATIVGASSTIGMAGLGFSKGLPGAWWMLSGTIGLFVLAFFFAERIRATGCFTLPQLVGSFYGDRSRLAASVLIAVSWVGVIAVQILASGKVLSAVFGGSQTLFMVGCTAVFVLYTAHGGQSSVVRTDLAQLLIIVCGMILLFFKSLSAAGPGLLAAQSFPTSAQMGGWDVLSMVLVVGSAYLVGPDMYSRLFSANSPKDARISAFIAAIILIPLSFIITLLGVFSGSLFPEASPEQAIPSLLTSLLSPGMEGLVAAALLAAFMSSADTSLMTATSILTFDIYNRARPNAVSGHLLHFSKAMVLIIGASALLLAITIPSIIKTLLVAYNVFTSGLLLPVVCGFYKERLGLTSSGALSALIGGGATALLAGQSYPLLGMAVSALFLFGVSWLERLQRPVRMQ
ncbi:Sodium:solute symporter family protein [uncultured archaeon]|nr:Sodium:solute symporter family protein [uncultured archaeon]